MALIAAHLNAGHSGGDSVYTLLLSPPRYLCAFVYVCDPESSPGYSSMSYGNVKTTHHALDKHLN